MLRSDWSYNAMADTITTCLMRGLRLESVVDLVVHNCTRSHGSVLPLHGGPYSSVPQPVVMTFCDTWPSALQVGSYAGSFFAAFFARSLTW